MSGENHVVVQHQLQGVLGLPRVLVLPLLVVPFLLPAVQGRK